MFEKLLRTELVPLVPIFNFVKFLNKSHTNNYLKKDKIRFMITLTKIQIRNCFFLKFFPKSTPFYLNFYIAKMVNTYDASMSYAHMRTTGKEYTCRL